MNALTMATITQYFVQTIDLRSSHKNKGYFNTLKYSLQSLEMKYHKKRTVLFSLTITFVQSIATNC